MANKIFLSHKFGDNQVYQGLDKKYWAENAVEATGRGYANWIEEIIGKGDIYKGESDGESLVGKTDEQIWEYLKPKIHDSTITIVAISKGMKDSRISENEQWIPQEIRYSLCEFDRGGRASATNALIGVVIPDRDNSYDYVWGKSNCSDCQHIPILKKDYFFNILKGNIFNKKDDDGIKCSCNSTIYNGDHSYLHLVSFVDFVLNYKTHIDKAVEIKDNCDKYKIKKEI